MANEEGRKQSFGTPGRTVTAGQPGEARRDPRLLIIVACPSRSRSDSERRDSKSMKSQADQQLDQTVQTVALQADSETGGKERRLPSADGHLQEIPSSSGRKSQ